MYDELESKECEVDDLEKSLHYAKDMCKRKSANNDKDQEDIAELKMIVEEQKVKISCLRKHRDEIFDRHEKVIDDYENEFKAKEEDIKRLQDASKHMKGQIEDLKEEIGEKDVRLVELQTKITSKDIIEETIKATQTSLSEEIAQAESERIKMDLQHQVDLKEKELSKSKISAQKRIGLFKKMESLQNSNQERILKLEEKIKLIGMKIPRCKFGNFCIRRFCKFDHSFVYRKVNNPTSEFSCDECDEDLKSKCELKDHMKSQHEAMNLGVLLERESNDKETFSSVQEDLDAHKSSEESFSITSLEESLETESESGEVCISSEYLSISSGGNVIVQLSD